jgi:hypothetical protein
MKIDGPWIACIYTREKRLVKALKVLDKRHSVYTIGTGRANPMIVLKVLAAAAGLVILGRVTWWLVFEAPWDAEDDDYEGPRS